MNYIHKLQREIQELTALIEAHKAVERELRSYLDLAKFKTDTTVQVSDIYHRLDNFDFYLNSFNQKLGN